MLGKWVEDRGRCPQSGKPTESLSVGSSEETGDEPRCLSSLVADLEYWQLGTLLILKRKQRIPYGLSYKGWLGIANLKKIYKDRLDLGVTWLKWLPHSMEQYGRLAPKSNKVNYQKLTLYFKKIHR